MRDKKVCIPVDLGVQKTENKVDLPFVYFEISPRKVKLETIYTSRDKLVGKTTCIMFFFHILQ